MKILAVFLLCVRICNRSLLIWIGFDLLLIFPRILRNRENYGRFKASVAMQLKSALYWDFTQNRIEIPYRPSSWTS